MKPIAVYDGISRKRLCYLQNAHGISYSKQPAALWTASFKLPYGDPKKEYCASMNFAEIWDVDSSGGDKYVGLFRIMPKVSERSSSGSAVEYELEHVMATLLDDTMIGWHEIGNLGVYTKTVLSYILGAQNVRRWALGACDYSHQYLYGWQDENLLSALYSVPKSFSEDDCCWEFDTASYPWTLSLRRAGGKAVTDIRYRKNVNGIQRTSDPTNLATRLYCYGHGEADNRLNIKGVNGGLPYLDSPNIAKYGLITRIWTDERFTHEESLIQSGRAMLKALEEPLVSYDIDIAAVRKAADLEAGDMVRVVDEGEDIYTRVVEVSKDDVSGEPLAGTVVLANKNSDISQSVADLADRQRIAATYSQGAESLFADSLYDNADQASPAELSFTVPDNAVHVNEILFSARLTNFRAYSKATQGGGAVSTSSGGGGSSQTSSGSGGSSQTTSGSGGSSQTSSGSGGGSVTSSGSGGGTHTSSGIDGGSAPTSSVAQTRNETSEAFVMSLQNLENTTSNDDNGKNHNHGISRGTGLLTGISVTKKDGNVTGVSFSTVNWAPSGAHTHGSHNHRFKIPEHSHTVNVPTHSHTVDIREHDHGISLPMHTHSVNIPSHTHSVSIPSHTHSVSIPSHTHDVTLPNHTHDIQYGIYKGSSASAMLVQIDDAVVGQFGSSASNVNLIAYMAKNANGEVLRGRHTIRITPNSLTRVECAIQIRLFTNARGSGQY